jgi:transposase
MAFIRKIKRKDAIYLAKVESYRDGDKVRQRVLEYIGKEENGEVVQKVDINKIDLSNVKNFGNVSVFVQLCKQLNLHVLLGDHYKSIITLLIGHLLCKGSIKKILSWIDKSTIKEELEIDEISTEMLYNSFDYLEKCKFNKIEQSIYEHWNKIAPKDNSAYVLDVTDTYHNGKNNKSSLRRGKDGKISKLVQIGLAVSFENGFPILHKTYGGNISNIKILEDLLVVVADRGLKSIVLDRGFYSEANITDMNNLKMKMIVGVKQSAGIKTNILEQLDKESIYIKKNLIQLKTTTVYAIEQNFLFGKLIIIYNPKYDVMKKDRMLVEGATDKEVKTVGYSLIFHNTKMRITDIVKKYYDKDVVERSFKILKGEGNLHPIRLWLPERVNAHVKLCYLSICLLALMKYRCINLDLSIDEILEQLDGIYKVKLKHSQTNVTYSKTITQSNTQKKVIKALKCSV